MCVHREEGMNLKKNLKIHLKNEFKKKTTLYDENDILVSLYTKIEQNKG